MSALAKTAAAAKALATARKKKRGEALIALIERRRARIVEDFYDIGEALRELLRDELYAALGYASFEALLDDRGLVSVAQARKLISVVDSVPREDALALGQERAYALVSYAAATPEDDTVAGLVSGGATITKASVREIRAAARGERAKAAANEPPTAAQKAKAKQERSALAQARALLRAAGVARPTLAVKGDAVLVTLPFALLERLARD